MRFPSINLITAPITCKLPHALGLAMIILVKRVKLLLAQLQGEHIMNGICFFIHYYQFSYHQFRARGLYGAATNLMGKIERASGIAPNLNTLFVYADTGDRVHNGDVESILKDVNNLHKRLINLLPIPADAICPEKIDHEKFAKCGFPMVRPAVPSVYKYTDKFKNVTLVADDFSIQIPDSWMPLLDNEVVIATSGQVPKMTCIKWFLSIISCGVYYIMKVR